MNTNDLFHNSAIAALWQGTISPQESGLFDTPELTALLRDTDKLSAELEKTLTEEQKAALEKLEHLKSDYTNLSNMEIFIYAFRLGAKMMLEIMEEPPV